jgi:hypothetical protein
VCEHELEGVVAKRRASRYLSGERGWIKTKNRDYWRYEMDREGALKANRRRGFSGDGLSGPAPSPLRQEPVQQRVEDAAAQAKHEVEHDADSGSRAVTVNGAGGASLVLAVAAARGRRGWRFARSAAR